MRALQVHSLTGPDGLVLSEVPEPDAGGQVLVDVHSAGVSFPDLLMSRGTYQVRPVLPFTPGVEAAGTVLAAPRDSGLEVGDRVAAFCSLGAWAERLVAAPELTFGLPGELTFEQGAGLIMNYQTAYFGLRRRGNLQPGETVLVQGAGGGVGTAAIQVARGLGAQVIAMVSSESKEQAAQEAGADHVLRTDEGWRQRVLELTEGRGVDVVCDPVGGERFHESLRCLAPEGRLVVIGFAEGTIPQLALNRILLRNVSVVGAAWGHLIAHDPGMPAQIGEELARLIAEGYVRPIVGAVYPLEEGSAALRELEFRRAVGKVVLRVRA